MPRDCWNEEQSLHSFSHRGGLQPAPTRAGAKPRRLGNRSLGLGPAHTSPGLWSPPGQAQLPAGPSTCGDRWGQVGTGQEALSTGLLQANAGARQEKAMCTTLKLFPCKIFCHFLTNFPFRRRGKKDLEQRRAEALNTP